MKYSAINIQGNIISTDILTKVRQDELRYQKPQDFGLDAKTPVREEIGVAWAAAQGHWNAFKLRRDRLKETDTGTSETRNSWVIPLMRELGYELDKANAETINGKSYAISHRDQNRDGFPVHIVGINQSLDKRADSGPRLSAHGLVQEYLNNHEHLYSITTNGQALRLLRDATRLARLTYLEFDLQQIMEEELYSEFALMFRVLHASRMPTKQDLGAESIIEYYHQEALANGTRIRERLSESVEKSLRTLANGFLAHPHNLELRDKIEADDVTAQEFLSQLLRLVYRLLFLLVIEERNLLYPSRLDDEGKRKRNIYQQFYSLHRLTGLAQSRIYVDPRKTDLWQSLLSTFQLFEYPRFASKLSLQALGSGIFAPSALALIKDCRVNNEDLLRVLGNLTTIENDQKQLTIVNYADLDVEEFGSVYEGLLDLNPYFQHRENGQVVFAFSAGTDRKETGSYYTSHDLVAQLLKTSLDPLIEERLKPHKDKGDRIRALLDIKVCDPACGSGHFLLAASRKLALRIAIEETGEENPGKEPQMEAMRLVIQHCIYGVDKNPAAVELCKVALWIEGHSTGKPLSFLDHRIRPGDSLVGVDKMERLKEGIPDGAFKPMTGDDKKSAQAEKKSNKAWKKSKQATLFFANMDFEPDTSRFASSILAVEQIPGDNLAEIEEQAERYKAVRSNTGWWKDYNACNLFTYAFYQRYEEGKKHTDYVGSEFLMRFLQSAGNLNAQLEARAQHTALNENFFHWPLEFPEIAERGGFDLMLGNPPWERIKLQEKEFFQSRSTEIANAPNAAARKRLIKQLVDNNPKLHDKFLDALHTSEAAAKFIRDSSRYPLTGRGDINTYSIFSEVIKDGINPDGHAGFIVPTGIATDDTNKFFFADLVKEGRLISLFDFENRKAIFSNVHRSYKFCLLTIGSHQKERISTFGFFLHDVLDLQERRRIFHLTKEDFLNINPNTKTTPIFRTRQDAELTAKIYSRVPVLVNEEKGQNPWGISFMRMFDMSNDSHLFRTEAELKEEGFSLKGNRFIKGEEIWLPLYEGKMFMPFDHRFADVEVKENLVRSGQPIILDEKKHLNALKVPLSRYWTDLRVVDELYPGNYIIGYKRVSATTNERTLLSTFFPKSGVGDSIFMVNLKIDTTDRIIFSISLNNLIFDYVTRQKLGGININYFTFEQLPLLTPTVCKHYAIALEKAAELIYTSWDIKAFADDLWKEADDELKAALEKQWEENKAATGGHKWEIPEWADAYPEIDWERDKGCPLPPFKWDEGRRHLLKSELDAYFALLYGLERDELRYILDPKEVHGKDFPGETFRVLQNKEMKKYGEYRTRRLVLEAYDRLRPTWDMEAHLKKLKEIWEECQVDLTKTEKPKVQPDPKTPKPAETPKVPDLFTPELATAMKEFSLHEGIYSIRDTADIIGQPYGKVRRWFLKLSEAHYEGLSDTDKTDIEDRRISFHGLVELVVIGTLLENGFRTHDIFRARKDLGKRSRKIYPFATNNVRDNLKVAGSAIIFEFPDGPVTLDGSGQINLEFIREFFRDIEFDTEGVAQRLLPSKGKGRVVIDPKVGGGKPALKDSRGVQVDTVLRFYDGPDSIDSLIADFEITKEDVEAALSYTS